jgi:hypothetical protein
LVAKGDFPSITPNQFRRSPRTYEIGEEEAAAALRNLLDKFSTLERWQTRRREVRTAILKAARLDPLPEKTPLNPTIRDRKEAGAYTVENVALETFPGFFCTGNLYRPAAWVAPIPAVLSPHGHFAEEGGRFSADVQIRCAHLAQMGVVAFAYDMVGWGESVQVPHTADFVFSYQLWNSIRALDFLLGLDEVDPSRVGATGCSGGGTQTFMLTAVDERVRLSVPVTMVSAHYFGGCVCESGIPVHDSAHTNNVEIAALAAPRPQLLISVGTDFTRNTPDVEFPFLKSIYGLYDAAQLIENVHLPYEQHDYGYRKREAMYAFIVKHFRVKLDSDEETTGTDVPGRVRLFTKDALSVFTTKEMQSHCLPMTSDFRSYFS